MSTTDALLVVEDLHTRFELERGVVQAVSGSSFSVDRGETLGIVGESGSGKSVTVRSILRLIRPPGRIAAGRVPPAPTTAATRWRWPARCRSWNAAPRCAQCGSRRERRICSS